MTTEQPPYRVLIGKPGLDGQIVAPNSLPAPSVTKALR